MPTRLPADLDAARMIPEESLEAISGDQARTDGSSSRQETRSQASGAGDMRCWTIASPHLLAPPRRQRSPLALAPAAAGTYGGPMFHLGARDGK